jgi:UDP-glucose 4-epimerase
MKCFVTGGCGFVASHLVDRLLKDGHSVTIYDNLSTGKIIHAPLVKGDVADGFHLSNAMNGHDIVFHLAANADVRFGTQHPDKDLMVNTLGTFNVLEAMRANGITQIMLSSTGSVYGEPNVIPTPEDAPMPIQTSLYAASKLAGESLIQAYCEGFGFRSWIFRFVSILGERYSHGHVIDFYRQLKEHPDHLDVLGDGTQNKSYLYVGDCINGIITGMSAQGKVNIFNLGTDETCTVKESIKTIQKHLGTSAHVNYAGGKRGWVGDSPLIHLDCSRIRALGWKPKKTIKQSIEKTVQYLEEQ